MHPLLKIILDPPLFGQLIFVSSLVERRLKHIGEINIDPPISQSSNSNNPGKPLKQCASLLRLFSFLPDTCWACDNTPGPVVRTLVSANPGLNFNPGFFFFLSNALSRIIFYIFFSISNHQIVGKENSTELAF